MSVDGDPNNPPVYSGLVPHADPNNPPVYSGLVPHADPNNPPVYSGLVPHALTIDGAMMPLGVKPKEAARLIGGSRSEVYRLLRQGRLHAVKRGATLLVLTGSIVEHMASLPAATFGAGGASPEPKAKDHSDD